MTQITLQSNNINGSTAVVLNGANATYTFKPLTRTAPLATAFTLSEAQVSGYENPRIVIRGYIDTNNIPTNGITMPLLRDFAKVNYDGTNNTAIYLTLFAGKAPVYAVGAESTTAWTSSQTIKVIVESFNISMDNSDSDLAHFWTYSLNLVETA